MSTHSYPVRVDAVPDDRLSRWLWLVKWVLVIPHYVVLAFLWAAFVVLSAVAMVAIVVTGRYPRGIFDVNVGVLRWSWRVAYYAYGGLATDRYPPFTLAERPDYPAHLEVAYPEHLSRGLALVKWWLLAIPHYLVVGIFLGGAAWAADTDRTGSIGLIGLLVLVAAVVLLFTGRYPRPVFDLVLGLNRWVLRVAAYAALMTDDYPPFRLDLGGADPGTVATVQPAAPAPPAPPAQPVSPTAHAPARPLPPQPRRGWGVGRVVAAVAGSVLALGGLGLLAGGGAVLAVDGVARDADGFLTSPSVRLDAPGHALVSERVSLDGGSAAVEVPRRPVGELRVEATSAGEAPVFVGVADSDELAAYLAGVGHSTVTDLGDGGDDPSYDVTTGGAPTTLPADADVWLASAEGVGEQQVVVEPTEGEWTVVLMNADGSAPVAAEVRVGAEVPVLDDIGVWLLVGGGVVLVLAGLTLWTALRGPSRD